MHLLVAETWPYIITLLTKCVALEISSSKKRLPKILYAKTLRMAVQCAEDPKLLGLLPKIIPKNEKIKLIEKN